MRCGPCSRSECSRAQLNESGKQWRHIYKSLTLLEYLVKNGSERVVADARDHIYEIKGALVRVNAIQN